MPARLLARAAALTAVIVAAIHIATLHDHFKHQPYIGALFLGLVAGMAWTTLALWQREDDALAWWGVVGLLGLRLALIPSAGRLAWTAPWR